jgi:DNA-directed RNA polymerase subunit H (RpoH/RPB5)
MYVPKVSVVKREDLNEVLAQILIETRKYIRYA